MSEAKLRKEWKWRNTFTESQPERKGKTIGLVYQAICEAGRNRFVSVILARKKL